MSSSSKFGLTDNEAVYELASQLHSGILDIFGYGIYTSVYFVALYLTLSRETERPRTGSAILITAMWILVTIHTSINWTHLDDIYIRHGESREAQLTSLFLSGFEHFLPQYIVDVAVIFISLLLADMTMIWRCWVLHGRSWHIIVIPGLSLAAGSVSFIWRTVLNIHSDGIWKTDLVANLELAFLSATVLTNILCTTAIVYRIAEVSGWRKSMKTYRRFIEILIESSILYTAIYTIRIGLQIHTQYFTQDVDERARFAQALGYSITGIAPTLVIARVAAGFARPDDSWTRSSLPHPQSMMRSGEELQFARPATDIATNNASTERRAASSQRDGAPCCSWSGSLQTTLDETELKVEEPVYCKGT